MENKKEINISENRYAKHRNAIRHISETEGVDIGTACAILRHDMGWTFPDGVDHEITEFVGYINRLPGEKVREFFGYDKPGKA